MIIVNGVPSGAVLATDRGLAYGDGVFRTFPARRGRPVHWQGQYAKLAADAAALAIAAPSAAVLEAEVRSACGEDAECTVKVVLTRGAGRRGYGYAGDEKPTRIVAAGPQADYPAAYQRAGVAVRLCKLKLGIQPALAGLKHLNRLENVLARGEWRGTQFAEGILRDRHDNVIGGTMTNLFIVVRGVLATPNLDGCGVAGVTRERVIGAAGHLGLTCAVERLTWGDVLSADEVFLTNSLAGVWPVCRLEDEARVPGPLTRAIQAALEREDHAPVA